MSTSSRPVPWALIMLLAVSACSGNSVSRSPDGEERVWSSPGGRLELERTIGTRRDLKGGGPGRWLSEGRGARIFERPYGVTWDGDDLLVTDPGARRVSRIDRRGRMTSSPRGALESPIGIASCSLGVVVTDSRLGSVEVLDANLRPKRKLATDLDRPTGVECSGDHVFVAETGRHRILVLSISGREADSETMEIWGRRGAGEGEFNFPTALALGAGSLWVADTLNFRVQRLDPDSGEFLGSWGELGDSPGELPRIKGLTVGAGSDLWISDAHLDQLGIFRSDGLFLLSVGTRGAAPGQFSFPAGLSAHPDGRIAVVDSLNRRLQIFRWLPASVSPTTTAPAEPGDEG